MTRILIGMRDGIFGYDPDADTTAQMVLPGVQPKALATDPSDTSRIYCATYNRGLWRSENAGETWLPIGAPQDYYRPVTRGAIGPRETTFVSVGPNPESNGRHAVWVGTEPSSLYRSTDHGETFECVTTLELPSRASWSFPPRPETHHVQSIAHGVDGSIHVAIEFGAMLRSFDGGRSFEDRRPGSPLDTHALLTHPVAPGRLYAAVGDALMERGHSFAESPDNGDTWQYYGRGLEAKPYLYDLAINPRDPDDILVAASSGPRSAHFSGGSSIFRRQGEAWVEDADGFPSDRSLIPVLRSNPTSPGSWFALSNLGLFCKDPGACAWSQLAVLDVWRDMNPMSLAAIG